MVCECHQSSKARYWGWWTSSPKAVLKLRNLICIHVLAPIHHSGNAKEKKNYSASKIALKTQIMSNLFPTFTAIIRKFRIKNPSKKLRSVSLILCVKWGFHYPVLLLCTDVFYRSIGPVFSTLGLGTVHDSQAVRRWLMNRPPKLSIKRTCIFPCMQARK